MGSGINAILTVPVYAILYSYTAVGVVAVVILSWFKAKKPVQFLCRIWAKSVFLVMGKS